MDNYKKKMLNRKTKAKAKAKAKAKEKEKVNHFFI